MMRTPPEKFSLVTISLHWIVAAFMAVTLVYGLVARFARTVEGTQSAMVTHQSFGAAILLLALIRVAVRLSGPAPPLPASMPRYQKALAAATHVTLYAALFFFPISGYVALAARGREISMFGLFNLPNLIAPSRFLSGLANEWHYLLGYVLYALIALHIVAALYHQFIVKDGLMKRMWP